MPARRELTMRQLRQMLRLHHDGVSAREIGRTLGVARSTIQDNLERALAAGIGWPLPVEWSDEFLEQRLFARSGVKPGRRRRSEPDWTALARELKRPGVNLMVLWEEYRQVHPDGYGYSRFCDLYREFERRLSPVMRQHHIAGDKVFVDYSGKKIAIVDPATGEVREAEIFVAVLGASNYTYAEATWTQTLSDWIEAHVRMFRFFGGAPRLVVPDNLKSGVHKASFYDPEINRSYAMMAAHYGVGILPARPYRPRDKAKVEAGVRFAQTYILGRLRHQTFFSLAEANRAIVLVLERMNAHVMRRLGLSRSDLFASVERGALRALPASEYEFAEWRLARVGLDYHVEIEGFYYSVPHALIRAQSLPPRRRGSMCASPAAPSKCSITPNASPPISVATAARVTAPIRTTCRARIGATPHGRQSASNGGRDPSVPIPKASWLLCSPTVRIPSRAFAPASACCACFAGLPQPAPRPLRPAHSPSGRSPTRASPPFSKTISIALHRPLRVQP
jgi:transposase